MSVKDLPTINASLNALSFVFLLWGYFSIKAGNKKSHIKAMSLALLSSTIFLACYLVYHYYVGSVPYEKQDWTRTLYFSILIPHIILAALMVPGIVALVWFALNQQFQKHKKVARIVWPVWVFVSVSGVIVYWMLYRL